MRCSELGGLEGWLMLFCLVFEQRGLGPIDTALGQEKLLPDLGRILSLIWWFMGA